MNDATRRQLAEYLDGRLSPEARRRVEALVARDPEARAELDSLREFNGLLEDAAPAAVAAPPELRARVMERIKAGQAGRPESPGWSAGAKTALVAGAVLTGVLGGLMVWDLRHGAGPGRAAVPSSPAGAAGSGNAWTDLPGATRGSERSAGSAGANASPDAGDIRASEAYRPAASDEIQGAGGGGSPASAGARVGSGIFSHGQGTARRLELPGRTVSSAPAEDLAVPAGGRPAAAGLESDAGWTAERLRTAAGTEAGTAADPETLLSLARKYRLNPGLLAAVARDFPRRGALELALAMRTSLNATHGQPRAARLARLAADLGGPSDAAARWSRAAE